MYPNPRPIALGLLCGSWLLTQSSSLPEFKAVWPALLIAVLTTFLLLVLNRRLLWLNFVLTGVLAWLYAAWTAQAILTHQFPQAWEGQDLTVVGRIAELPEYDGQTTRFLLHVESAQLSNKPRQNPPLSWQGNLRLSWYAQPNTPIKAGERWSLLIRARQPNGVLNTGGFDYERWLLVQRIHGVGYVRFNTAPQRLTPSPPYSLLTLRQWISDTIATTLDNGSNSGLIQGLAVANRSQISTEQWDVLQRTGTGHLLAISGLHIGLVAALGFLPIAGIWWLLPHLYLKWPVRSAGAALGAVLAIAYALLAGFSLPTQRALVMILLFLAALLTRQRWPFSSVFSVALIAVVLLDPLASLSAGFWLSFGAVAMLAWLWQRRLKPGRWPVLRLQLGLFFGMLPLTAAWFGNISLISPLANVIAIPWVSFTVVPLVLLGVISLPLSTALAGFLWWLASQSLAGLWWLLTYLAHSSFALLSVPALPNGLLLVVVVGSLLLLMPSYWPARWLSAILLLPLLFWQSERPLDGAFRLQVLDIGQGLAVAVQTHRHTLIFDAGPRSQTGFDSGERVLIPWLQARGIQTVDALVVSHADLDHSGGADSLIAAFAPKQLWVNDGSILPQQPRQLCQAGQQWTWDGVDFVILHPSTEYVSQKRNDRSCVLRISTTQQTLLLVSDIERAAEYWLLKQPVALKADVMLVPHHGSQTSSTPAFLKAIQPQLAIVSTGYGNRFHHPHPTVKKRYEALGIQWLNTVETGEIQVDFVPHQTLQIELYRPKHRRFWHR